MYLPKGRLVISSVFPWLSIILVATKSPFEYFLVVLALLYISSLANNPYFAPLNVASPWGILPVWLSSLIKEIVAVGSEFFKESYLYTMLFNWPSYSKVKEYSFESIKYPSVAELSW